LSVSENSPWQDLRESSVILFLYLFFQVLMMNAEEILWACSSFKNCVEVLELSCRINQEQEKEKNA